MSDDLIRRQDAIDAVKCGALSAAMVYGRTDAGSAALSETVKAIKALPTAQPETANIIVGKSRDGMTMWYQCDNCNEPVDENDLYCRGCGRRLEHGSD